MKTLSLFLMAAAGLGSAFAANPVIRDSSVTVPDSSSTVTIRYALDGAPAVVTVDIRTNGVSIGARNFANVSGDVNRLVAPGEGRTIKWKAYKTWPDRVFRAGELTAVVTAWPTNQPPDYAVVDLASPYAVRYYVSTNALPLGGLTNRLVYCREKLVLRRIPAAAVTFRMGDNSRFPSSGVNYPPKHLVTLSGDYYMAIYPLTGSQHNRMFGDSDLSGYYAPKEECPLISCWTWTAYRGAKTWPQDGHAVGAGSLLDTWRARTGLQLDFPTEAQWEYAARAGTTSKAEFLDGLGNDEKLKYGWFGYCSPYEKYYGTTTNASGVVTTNMIWKGYHPVGLLRPNQWGLYDMQGNAWDQCLDYFTSNVTGWERCDFHDNVVDPAGVAGNSAFLIADHAGNPDARVMRGGCFANGYGDSTCGMRYTEPGTKTEIRGGIRLVCPACVTK